MFISEGRWLKLVAHIVRRLWQIDGTPQTAGTTTSATHLQRASTHPLSTKPPATSAAAAAPYATTFQQPPWRPSGNRARDGRAVSAYTPFGGGVAGGDGGGFFVSIDDDDSSGVGGGRANELLYGDDEGREDAMGGGGSGAEDEGRSVLSALGRPALVGGRLREDPGYAGGGAAMRIGQSAGGFSDDRLERAIGSSNNGWIGSASSTSAPSATAGAAAGGMMRRGDRRPDQASGNTASVALSGDDDIVGRSGDADHFHVHDCDDHGAAENEMLRAWEEGGGGAAIGEEWVGAGRSMAFAPSPRDEMDGDFSGVVGDDGADKKVVERRPQGRRQLAASRTRRVGMFEWKCNARLVKYMCRCSSFSPFLLVCGGKPTQTGTV